MSRKKTNHEQMPGRFPEGTFDRIDAVRILIPVRTGFLRVAVDKEVQRRERRLAKN